VRLGVNQRGTQRTVTARVPAGVKDGQKLRLRGQGAQGPGGAGDIVVTVEVEPDPVFTWDGTALRLTVPVTFAEAALGAEIEVPTPDGVARLKVPAGTPGGRTFRVKGRGPVVKGSPVDLLATVQVVVPQRLDAEGRAAVETLRRLDEGTDPRAGLLSAAASARGAGKESA
jgi:molecular chaperone DnaJ